MAEVAMAEQHLAFSVGVAARPRWAGNWRAAMWGVALVCGVAGFMVTSAAATAGAVRADGGELVMLLRFMATVKTGMALGLVALAAWRMGFPARPGMATWYAVACGLMPAGAGLIWGMAHVAIGAVLFHAGMLLMMGVGYFDRDDGGVRLTRAALGRRG
jgi:hypothetical protein